MMNDDVRLFGFDLAKKKHEVVICDCQGTQLHRFDMPRGHAGWECLQQQAARWIPAGGRGVYLVESAQSFWQEVVHPLVAQGEETHLLHPVKCADLRKFYRRHTKTDTIDALSTARVWLTDRNLNPAWVGTPEQESLKRLCRLHWKLGEDTRNLKRRLSTQLEMILPGIGGIWKNHYCRSARLFYRRYLDPAKAKRLGKKRLGAVIRKRAWGKFSEEKEAALWSVIGNAPALCVLREDLQLEIQCLLDGLEMLEQQQERLAERIDELYTAVDPDHRLESVPGLGPILAASINSVIGDIDRWPSADRLVAYSGLVGCVNETV
jgi:transposase